MQEHFPSLITRQQWSGEVLGGKTSKSSKVCEMMQTGGLKSDSGKLRVRRENHNAQEGVCR